MSEPSEQQNHYATLGVERSADVRAIKKAYFALVRQFPPESHPEEFKRVRAAYEVLSDPEARDRYDEQEKGYREYEDDVAAALAAAEEAASSGDEEAAQSALRAAIEAHPDVLMLRERLVSSLARAKEHEAALAEIDLILERSPDTARYHFLRSLALRALDRMDDAEAALRRAHELAPEDEAIEDAFVGVLSRNKRVREAIEVLDRAAERCDAGGAKGIGVQVKRVHVLYQGAKFSEAEHEVEKLVDLARASSDPEVPRLVASELGAPAAALFATDETDRANHVLERCHVLHPESPVLRPYPARVTLDTDMLPRAAIDWLREREQATDGPTLRAKSWGLPLGALVGACLLALVAYLLLDIAPGPPVGDAARWEAPVPFSRTAFGVVVLLALFTGAAALGVHFLRAMLRRRKAPFVGLTTVHPLYLIQATPDQVTLYPLFGLTRTEGVHHGQNGVYTHTALSLGFGKASAHLIFHNAGFAQAWLDYLLGARKRALELLAAGYLEAEHGVELLPPALLSEQPRKRRPWWQEDRRWLLGAGAAALGLLAASQIHGYRLADELSFRDALARDTVPAYEAYLRDRPEGRFAPDARRIRDGKIARVEEAVGLALGARPEGARAPIADFALALAKAGARAVPVRLTVGGDPALDAADSLRRLPEQLAQTLGQAGLTPSAVKRLPATGAMDDPAVLDIACDLRPGGSPRELPAGSCTVRVLVRAPSGDGGSPDPELHRFEVQASGLLEQASGDSPIASALLSKILQGLGLESLDTVRRLAQKPAGRSPYVH